MAGAGEGIEFRFDRIAKLPNTFDAHRLIWLAGSGARQDAVVEKLFHAYFIKGEDVGDPVVLTRIGLEAGLDRNSIDQLFHTNLATEEVRSEERLAIAQGVGGVPSFFLEGELIASGAQAPELLARSLAPALLGEGTQCSVDGPCA
jgi:predicted DsbA family dithiol-disulfide isomerase